MRVEDFNYELPEELIAQEPIEPRDASRLLVLDRTTGALRHRIFREISQELRQGDLLVINDTKVLPSRLYAKTGTGAAIELLLLQQVGLNTWQTLVKPGRRAPVGTELHFDIPEIRATIVDLAEEGTRVIEFHFEGDFYALLERLGRMPLPPYIKTELADQGRYQTVYAREQGSAAAPTAGLHFTNELLQSLQDQGVGLAKILLHVGLGTFRPVKADQVEDHHMHSEFYRIDAENAAKINAARAAGGRIIAVGTTSVRTLESVAIEDGSVKEQEGWTDKYIYPGYQFKIVDGMITNFHLPKSTLVMLVAAFADLENILHAYNTAVEERYRFFSFGDAMLLI